MLDYKAILESPKNVHDKLVNILKLKYSIIPFLLKIIISVLVLLDVNLHSILFLMFFLHVCMISILTCSVLILSVFQVSRHSLLYFHVAHNVENFFQISVVYLMFYCKIRINPQIFTFETSRLSADVKDLSFHS